MKCVAWGSLHPAAMALSACGGGGSSANDPYSRPIDSGLLSRPIDLGGKQPDAPAPVTPLSLAVTVNGAATTPDSSGQVSVKPGDVVSVVPNQTANWTTGTAPADAISLRNPQTSQGQWTARLVNDTTSPAAYAVKAAAAVDATQIQTVTFNVAAGDARNGNFQVFASNGSKQRLSLNFDLMSYDMTDNLGSTTSNDFAADTTQTGTYVFKSTFNTAVVNNARFRMAAGTIVGSFPFTSNSGHVVQPFIASRAPVTAQSELDGTYIRFGVDITGPSRLTNVRQLRVSGGGTKLEVCKDPATEVNLCSIQSLQEYNLAATTTAGSWRAQNAVNATDWFTFSMAKVNGKNVYLDAGISAADPSLSIFRVGLGVGSTWPATTAVGGDSNATWGTLTFDSASYTASLTSEAGPRSGPA